MKWKSTNPEQPWSSQTYLQVARERRLALRKKRRQKFEASVRKLVRNVEQEKARLEAKGKKNWAPWGGRFLTPRRKVGGKCHERVSFGHDLKPVSHPRFAAIQICRICGGRWTVTPVAVVER